MGALFGTAQSSEAVSSSVANALGAPLPLQDDPSVEEVPVTMEVLDASDVPEPAGLTLPKPSLQATLPPVKPKIEARPSREARLEALSEAQQATAREEERPSEAIQRTVVPGASTARILTLQEKGALLQKVHFGGFMEGYDVYLGSQGRVATRMLNPRATLQVRGKDVRLVAHGFGVSANGTPLSPGQSVLLTGENAIEVDGVLLQYEDLSTIDIPGWPYLGEVRRPGSGTYLPFGDAYRIGRDRRCRVRLPDEPHNDNLAWRASVEAGTTIRARGGDIPKARFYTDSIMVASEHAELDMTSEPIVRSLARHCYTFVRRGKEIFSLFPREGGAEGPKEMVVRPGDEMLVGNSLFQLNYLATDTAATISVEALEISPFDAPDAALPARRAPAPPPVSPKPITQGILAPTPSLFDAPPPAGLAASMKEDAARAEAEKAAIKAAAEKVAAERAAAEKLAAEQAAAEKAAAEKAAAEKATKLAAEKAAAADLPAERPAPKAEVIAVEERQWQLELSRPCKLVLNGWMVAGNAVVGNHSNANIVLPEVRATRDQRFSSRDYFKVFFRGKKGQIDVLQSGEASLKVGGVTAARTESVDDAELKVVRRDINGEPDFDIQLSVRTNPGLPDPRAAWLALDLSDRMVAALFTVGIPLRSERKARLGSFTASFFFDGEALHIKDYLDSYRLPDGSYLPAFKGQVGGEWQTLAEDGSEELLRRGESLLIGGAIYTLKA